MSLFQVTLSLICNFISVDPGKYILGPMQMHWLDAQLYCQDMGTTLASIHSESDNNEAISLCNTTCTDIAGCSGCWAGLNDIEFEGIWKWDDGSIIDYGFVNNSDKHPTSGEYPWAHSGDKFGPEPNNHATENCVQLWRHQNFKWNDFECLDPFSHPICNKPSTVTTIPTNIPTPEPTYFPSKDPTTNPTHIPTFKPTFFPSNDPTTNPTNAPTSEPTYFPSRDPTSDPTKISSNPPSFSPVRTVLSIDQLNTPTLRPLQIDQKVDVTVFESEYSQNVSISNQGEIEYSTKTPWIIILIAVGSVSLFLISAGFIIWQYQRTKVPRMLNVVSLENSKQFNDNKKSEQSVEAQPQRGHTNGEV